MGKAIIYLADGTEECEALLCADLLRRNAHTEIDDQPLAAHIGRGDDKVTLRPAKRFADRKLRPGVIAVGMAPEVPVKEDLPALGGFGLRNIDSLVIFFREAELRRVERSLKRVEVGPRLLYGRQVQGFRKRIQHAPLVLRQGIFPQEGVELRLLPLVRLFERRSISAGEQQTQKILKAVRQRVYKVRRTVHRADGKHRLPEAAHKAEMNSVHTTPSKHPRALRRAEIRLKRRIDPHHTQR